MPFTKETIIEYTSFDESLKEVVVPEIHEWAQEGITDFFPIEVDGYVVYRRWDNIANAERYIQLVMDTIVNLPIQIISINIVDTTRPD